MDTRCDELLRAALAKGTIRKVAEALDAQPVQLYRWIGGLHPSERDPSQVLARLRLLRLVEHYFERRSKPGGAGWQR